MTTSHDWTGTVGDTWAAEWRRTDRSLAALSRHLDAEILAAAPEGPFRALDIGCGAGATSLALAAARPDAAIVGIDLSAGLVAVARERSNLVISPILSPPRRRPGSSRADVTAPSSAPGIWTPAYAGVVAKGRRSFLTGDAIAVAEQHAPFDLLYSRHGVMFFDDPVAAFAALRQAASPGARLVFSCFQDWSRNAFASELGEAVGATRPDPTAPGPFAFADRDGVAGILADAGWRDAAAIPVDFAYRAGEGTDPIADALGFFQRIGPAAPAIRAALPDDRPAILARVTTVIECHRSGDAIDFPAAAWIWSATA